jgi:hypothetical protein
MPHAPSFDYARHPHRSTNLDPLLLTALAAFLSAAACTTAQSHTGDGSGGSASGGNTGNGSGGTTGSGGSANGSGGSGNGSGGATGSGGHVADAGGEVHAGSGGATGGCAGLPLCDDFEAASGTLNTALWTLVPTAASGTATIDSTGGAHGSGHSLKVVSPDRLYLRNSSVIGTLGPVVHVRFYARFMTALPTGHGAIVVTHNPAAPDQYSQQNELRFGSQDAVFHWNTDSDAANIPTVGPGDSSSVGVTPNTWYCYELTINTNGHLNVSINGNDVAGLTEDGVATPNIDADWVASTPSLMRYTAFGDFNFGWQSYGGGPMTIWFDDVALSSAQIGCSN